MTTPGTSPTRPGRRFLLAALGTAAAVPAAAQRADSVPPEMARKESEQERRQTPRYRETEHVRAFYRTNRY